MVTPIFLFSLPRSGSTLLQRVLASHSRIATTPEPWILLPLLTIRDFTTQQSEFDRFPMSQAITDFVARLPGQEVEFTASLRQFVIDLYSRQCRTGQTYFLDKTPRYYLIIPRIVELFPSAKLIFLFRPPQQVLTSIIETWGQGRMRQLQRNGIDIVRGIPLLAEAALRLEQRSLIVHYSELVTQPKQTLQRIAAYLDIEPTFPALDDLASHHVPGRMGDPTGIKKYSQISPNSLNIWKRTLGTSFRKRYARMLFAQFPPNTIRLHGTEPVRLQHDLRSLPEGIVHLHHDLWDFIRYRLDRLVHPG